MWNPTTLPAPGGAPFQARVRRDAEIQHDLQLAARTDVPVLITAEPGYAVKPIAFWIHSRSERRKTGLAVLDGSENIPQQTWSLFDRAARTVVGSRHERPVIGTVLLANVDGLPAQMQEELFRFLELRGPSGHPPVRVIAATAPSPFRSARADRLREDLFYRLNTIHIALTNQELRHLGFLQAGSEVPPAGRFIPI